VHAVSKVQSEDHQDAIAAIAGAASGILEDPDGVVHLRLFGGRELARADAFKRDHINGSYKLGQETYKIEWRRWCFKTLYWSHTTALLALQGASLQQLLPAWIVLRGVPRPSYDPLPGVNGVVLAEVFDSQLPRQEGPAPLPFSNPS